MKEMTNNLRTTTISLDEYNGLVKQVDELVETRGALKTTISDLNMRIDELKVKQPTVKVTHFTTEVDTHFDDWRDDMVTEDWRKQSKVEFINSDTHTELAVKQAKANVEKDIIDFKDEIKRLKLIIDTLHDNETASYRLSSKVETKHNEILIDTKEEYEKNLLKLKKASDEDTKNYKETIKELKEEIQKVKDSKTDVEIETKRNEEILSLQTRISDLESLIGNLRHASFFNRLFKVKSLLQEKDDAEIQVAIRKNNAKKVGTTWVKEGGKLRRFDAFKELYDGLTRQVKDYYTWATTKVYKL